MVSFTSKQKLVVPLTVKILTVLHHTESVDFSTQNYEFS